MLLSDDAKAIVASNLVIANALIYQEYGKRPWGTLMKIDTFETALRC